MAVFVVATLVSAPTMSRAGDYHTKEDNTLLCNQCHTMHYSEQHTYEGLPTGSGEVPLTGGPNVNLLRQPKTELCLACHDGQTFAPDVVGANTNTYTRGAGPLTDGGLDYPNTSGHSLGDTAVSPYGTWNGNLAEGLMCTHCHETHGNQYYRNLVTDPGNSTGITVSHMTGDNIQYDNLEDPKPSIQQLSKTPMATHYGLGNIKYRQNSTTFGETSYGLSHWCVGCHDSYGLEHPNNHSLPDPSVMQGRSASPWFGTLQSRVPVISPSDTIPGTDLDSDNMPFCGTCHKAHGSNHPNGELWDDASTIAPEDGALMDDTCVQCH